MEKGGIPVEGKVYIVVKTEEMGLKSQLERGNERKLRLER